MTKLTLWIFAVIWMLSACMPSATDPNYVNTQQAAQSLYNAANAGMPVARLSLCTPRTDWYRYTVKPSDTLAIIADQARIGIRDLMIANCFESVAALQVNQIVYVPIAIGDAVIATPASLPKTYTDPNNRFSFNYPAEWQFITFADGSSGGIIGVDLAEGMAQAKLLPVSANGAMLIVTPSISFDTVEDWANHAARTIVTDQLRVSPEPFSTSHGITGFFFASADQQFYYMQLGDTYLALTITSALRGAIDLIIGSLHAL